MNRKQLIKLAKEKIQQRLLSQQKNNYFVFWEGKEQKDIPAKSLVVTLTEYDTETSDLQP